MDENKEIKNLAVRVPMDLHKQVKSKLAEDGLSFQEFVNHALADYVGGSFQAPEPSDRKREQLLSWFEQYLDTPPPSETHAAIRDFILGEIRRAGRD